MHVDGRCHCGRITYEAEIDPAQVMICHCTDCQMLTGSAYRVNVRAPAASFRMLSGEPRIYVKTAESGNKRLHAFCPDCGTPVYSAAPVDTPAYALRIGCLAQRAELPPGKQQWCDSAVPWSASLDGVPRVARQ
jgi:hypothetical protein